MTSTGQILPGVIERAPSQFLLSTEGVFGAYGSFRVDTPDSVYPTTFAIRLSQPEGRLKAAERTPGELLPKSCPERHINPDGTFCVGLDAGKNVVTADEIDNWWMLLGQFLRVQNVANRTRKWPRHRMLSHGSAGKPHAEALEIAQRLSVTDDYELHLIGVKNWVTELVADYQIQYEEFVRKSLSTTRLSESVVQQADKAIAAAVPASKLTARKRRRLIRHLAERELERIQLEQEFWATCIKSKMVCCGTMQACPLKKSSTPKSPI